MNKLTLPLLILVESQALPREDIAMFWRMVFMKLVVDTLLIALLILDDLPLFCQTRKMIFICQYGLRFPFRLCFKIKTHKK